ncbi:DNA-3-methyladenine glycosylase family protein [Prauserella alba]|uniref:DNA-3-methyladenine glycosylase II n=1 Tax=Prauserella alba TaxID=176898 RepID=A0ABN1VR31_9PSEU|nr:DNA-3-methyladenine glycosylase 2 family protein [Prauserella alba]MCP2179524.1 DNA-3-methyladenine glycosylase II [Prauserella alba]
MPGRELGDAMGFGWNGAGNGETGRVGLGSVRTGPGWRPAAVSDGPGPAVTTRLEPAGRDDIALTASGSAAHAVAPAVGRDLWGADELRLAFLLDGVWRAVGVHVRRRSPAMLELQVTGAATGEGATDDGAADDGAADQGAAGAVSQADADRAVSQARRILSLDCDGAAFAARARGDGVLDGLRKASPGTRPILFGSPYEAACWAVVCQGLRTPQAVAMYARVVTRYGRVVPVGGRRRAVVAPPSELRAVSPATRLSVGKRERLAIVADAAASGLLDATALRAMDPGEAVELVRQLPGIGPLSAELIVARGAGHPDVFPAHDRWLLAAMRDLYDRPPAEVAEQWRPYRSWASFVIRSAVMLRDGGLRGGESRDAVLRDVRGGVSP